MQGNERKEQVNKMDQIETRKQEQTLISFKKYEKKQEKRETM